MIFNGKKIKLELVGGSHDKNIVLKIYGLQIGTKISENKIKEEIARRKSRLFFNTQRKEEDTYTILKGIENETIIENEIIVEFPNKAQKSDTYIKHNGFLRPGQADYANLLLEGKTKEGSGGLSGRMTLPMCFVGSIAKQMLEKKYNTTIKSRILEIYKIKDEPLSEQNLTKIKNIKENEFQTLNDDFKEKALNTLKQTQKEKDSVGGVVETIVFDIKPGIGEPLFDGLDNYISRLIFSIPGIKGIEFGDGFNLSKLKGSETLDSFYLTKDNKIQTKTNHNGGINAGISNGMPIIIRTAIKPPQTIQKSIKSLNHLSNKEEIVVFEGMHDICFANRAIPAIEGMIALAILDLDHE